MTFDRARSGTSIDTIPRMRALRSDTLFRIGGLLACAIVALPMVTRPLTGDITEMLLNAGIQDLSRINIPVVRLLLAAIPTLTAVVFGAALWFTTGTEVLDRPRRRAIVLLIVQAVLAALSTTGYFFIVAAQVPLVFAPVAALTWLAGQLAVVAALVIGAAWSGADVVIPEMAGAPQGVAFAVSLIYVSGWQIFAFGVGYLASSERRSRLDLQQRTRELMATQQMLADSSRVAERARISQELHDTIGHSLTVLNVNLELASHLTDGRASEAVTKAQTVARMLLADVREVVHSFDEERHIDLRGALTTLIADAHSPAIHLSLPDTLRVDDPTRAHAVFRCVQEAITNAVRHAHAQNLWIRLAQSPEGIDVRITDDGRGQDEVKAGHGLKGMRQRLEEVGGRLTVEAAMGRGFTIEAWVPAPREQP
jgi:signal transduction histidine kinase